MGMSGRKKYRAMSSLRWYRAVKGVLGVEKYVASWEGHEAIRLRFRQRTGSAGLLEDKRRCRLCVDERCVLCNRSEGEV